jgi:Fe(3+) dicitrate transport protein
MNRTLLFLAIATACSTAHADEPHDIASKTTLHTVEVVGSREQAALQPGSATVLDEHELQSSRVTTVGEALRKVPGVVVRDEEGFGLRPNIGIRGLNPTRSTKVLLLEDGLPFTYAPYGDNASYYHAPIERYERIEVLKGTGMLRFGPQTVGGVINYITPEPPREFGGLVDVSVGNLGYAKGRVRLGGAGHLVDVMHKQGDGARDNQSLKQSDLNYKYVVELADNQRLTLRANYLNEDSDVTYSGLTDAEYRNFGPTYNPFKNDHFDIERFGSSATWSLGLSDAVTLDTSVYYYEFHRDWGRQSSTTTDSQCGAAFTAARLAGSLVDVDTCNSRQNRNRDFRTWGIEPRLIANYTLGAVEGSLETGLRYHQERQERLQFNGTTPTATTGSLTEHNLREVEAVSGFVQNRFDFGRFALVPALRYERIDYRRENRLGAGAQGEASSSEWIGGLGATVDLGDRTVLFAGVHEGFAPARAEDLISNSGGSVEVDAERSRNAEIGLRGSPVDGVSYEVAWFDNDFDNQVAVGSIAGGSTPLAQGEARYRGLEVAARFDLGTLADLNYNPYAQLSYTALPEADQMSALRRVDNGQPVSGSIAGNRMPYAPEHTATLRVGFEQGGFDASLEVVHVSSQYADFANTPEAALDGNGQLGKLPGYTTLNLALNYAFAGSGWTLYGAVKNATDREYIADRTRGILPGAPRQFLVGASFAF